ncbi:hypothetical protein DH2020_018704 [Rehmannia glutinosa]|uniref:Gamma-glutamyltranspeptidase n=1 Tax=Rehmannia glutinosa TaxID=99300 RepID=A0ABR0WN98_REHGL
MGQEGLEASLLASDGNSSRKKRRWSRALWFLFLALIAVACLALGGDLAFSEGRHDRKSNGRLAISNNDIVESKQAVVAADDGRCSEIGVSMLEKGGHAVDATVATAVCLGVVSQMSSGIGGGGFMVVRSSSTSGALAIDMRETAPAAASQGALSMGIPGEIAGLHVAWSKYGRLPWRALFGPAISLAKEGFIVSPCLEGHINKEEKKIMNDPGLRQIYAPNGKLLKAGDMCYNVELGKSLQAVAEQGPEAFYNGTVGERLIEDVRKAGGILTMEDLRNYRVKVLNVLDSYGSGDAAEGPLGLHRLIEALKHMFAIRMNLGDPEFVNISETVSDMLSPSFAKRIREKIFDNTTFPLNIICLDHGTSHFCVVDADRNAVSMTTTVNYAFGGGVLSPSTGIDNQLAGVIGGSGGLDIIPAVAQVFINHFILKMEPLAAVQSARVYHRLIPNVVSHENWTVVDGEHIELPEKRKQFLRERGHRLKAKAGGQFVSLWFRILQT